MGEGLNFLDIVLVAMVAGFIFLRLRNVLGRRTGQERQRPDRFRQQEEAENGEDNVINLPEREPSAHENRAREAEAALWAEDSPFGAGLTQIKIADHNFEPAGFLEGARAAYEMVVGAFAEGDRATLRRFLNDQVYSDFERAIDERESAGQELDTTITAINSAEMVEVELKERVAEITVKFVSDMISVVKDDTGEVLGGTPEEREVTDIWTFARDTASSDPNWELIATSSEN